MDVLLSQSLLRALQIAGMRLQFDSVSHHHTGTFLKITNTYQNKKSGLLILFNAMESGLFYKVF